MPYGTGEFRLTMGDNSGERHMTPEQLKERTKRFALDVIALVGTLPSPGHILTALTDNMWRQRLDSRFITLLFIPCLYLLFERRRARRKGAEA